MVAAECARQGRVRFKEALSLLYNPSGQRGVWKGDNRTLVEGCSIARYECHELLSGSSINHDGRSRLRAEDETITALMSQALSHSCMHARRTYDRIIA